MDELVKKWLERSEYDIESANIMLNNSRYLYVAYMCQQSIEKLLKAYIAKAGNENLPIHNLNRLAESSEAITNLNDEQKDFLAELTPFCIEARYGYYKDSLSDIVNKTKAIDILHKSKEIYKCLLVKIN